MGARPGDSQKYFVMWVSLLEAAGHLSVVPNHCVVTAGELGTAPILLPASIPCFLGHFGVRALGLSLHTSMQVFLLEESLCKGDTITVRQILHVRAHTLISVYYPRAAVSVRSTSQRDAFLLLLFFLWEHLTFRAHS